MKKCGQLLYAEKMCLKSELHTSMHIAHVITNFRNTKSKKSAREGAGDR